MDDHGGVLARLDNLVQVADASAPHRPRQGAIDPQGLAALDQIAADQVRGGEVVVAGDGDEGALEAPGHVLHETGLAAARGSLEEDRQAVGVGGGEDLDLIPHGLVIGFVRDEVGLGLDDFEGMAHGGSPEGWVRPPGGRRWIAGQPDRVGSCRERGKGR